MGRLAWRSIRRHPRRSAAQALLLGLPCGLVAAVFAWAWFHADRYQAELLPNDPIIWLIGSVVVAGVSVVARAIVVASAQRRLRELGQLGAIGADDRHMRQLALYEVGLLVVTGVLVSGALGIALMFALDPSSAFDRLAEPRLTGLLWWPPTLVGSLTLGVALLSALGPVRSATRSTTVAALAGVSPRQRPNRWGVILSGGVLVLLILWRWRNDPGDEFFLFGVALVGVVFAVGATGAPLLLRSLERSALRASGSSRLALRDLARNCQRGASTVLSVFVIVTLATMAVAGLESDRGVYDPMDARYLLTRSDRPVDNTQAVIDELAATASVEIVAVAEIDEVRPVDRLGPGAWQHTTAAALTPELAAALEIPADVVSAIPAGGAIAIDGNDWPAVAPSVGGQDSVRSGEPIPLVVFDAGAGVSFGDVQLPQLLMRTDDFEALPVDPWREHELIEQRGGEFVFVAGRNSPTLRLHVAAAPLSDDALRSVPNLEANQLAVSIVQELDDGTEKDWGTMVVPLVVATDWAERHPFASTTATQWIFVAIALLVGVIVVIGMTRLVAGDLDPDISTMVAGGADPSLRRRVFAVRTFVQTLLGAVCGAVAGSLLFYLVTRGDASVPGPVVVWWAAAILVVALPPLAAAAVGAVFRSARPAVSRRSAA